MLGAVLLDQDARDLVLEKLQADDFYGESNRMIFNGALELATAGQQVDSITISDWLEKHGELDKCGGAAYLAELLSNIPGASVAEHYAEILLEKSGLRRLLQATMRIQQSIFESGEMKEALETAETAITEISEKRIKNNRTALTDIIDEVVKDYSDRRLGKEDSRLPCDYPDLQKLLGGFRGGEMIILAARPSMGKTTFALNLMYDLCVMHRKPVVFFSLEMGAKQIGNNLVCRDSGIDSHIWQNQTQNLKREEMAILDKTFARLAKAPLHIDDDPWLTPGSLHAKLRRYKKDKNIQAVFIDYLQLMNAPDHQSRDGRNNEITHISRMVKGIAREMELPIIALAQLNRGLEGRSNKRPAMSDLRDSGSIEQDADVIMLLHRADAYNENDRPGEADVNVAKHRNGPTGNVVLNYIKNRCLFLSRE